MIRTIDTGIVIGNLADFGDGGRQAHPRGARRALRGLLGDHPGSKGLKDSRQMPEREDK